MILELDSCPTNSRNGSYGGQAGSKEGIDINNEAWIVKYPKSTAGMRGPVASYTTSPLSEYVGSHIYDILGIPVHQTELGIRNNRLVVVCKDFCITPRSLREIREIKNIYNGELNKQLSNSISSTSDSHMVKLEDILIHLKYNPVLSKVSGITDRFWTQLIIDALINNNDRNNSNWGLLYENDQYLIAPVYDNGAAFSNKLPDDKLKEFTSDPEKMKQSVNTSRTAYSYENKPLYVKDIVKLNYNGLYRNILKIYPVLKAKAATIKDFINSIPESYNGMEICSRIKKDYFIESLSSRCEMVIRPLFIEAKHKLKIKD